MRQKITSFFVAFLLLGGATYGQQSTGGDPLSYQAKYNLLDDQIHTIQLPALNMQQVQLEDELDEAAGRLKKFSRLHSVNLNLANAGTWSTFGDGKIWKLKITATQALAVNLLYDNFYLPDGARLYIYNENKTDQMGAFTTINNKPHGKFATGNLNGNAIVLEYYEPNAVAGQGIISISHVGHAYRHVPLASANRADPCQVDVNCSPEGDNWQDQKKGVVRIAVVSNQGQGWCTGSMINNTALDCKNYVLTAMHCTDGSTTANFNQYIFYFNFERANCGSGAAPTNESVTGCIKIADSNDGGGNSGSDYALVEINSSIPSNYNIYLNGWNANSAASASGVSIHHPAGDEKKISTYSSALVSTQWGSGSGSHWQVSWVGTSNGHGVTEGGSSGSPIFDANNRIIGQLTGGGSYCSDVPNPSPDLYGKMSYNWQSNPGDNLKDFLDPGNTGAMTLDGTYAPCAPALNDDAGITTIVDPSGVICSDNFTPVVTLRNFGSNTLSSVTVNYDLDGGPNQTFNWSGSLASGGTTNVTLPSMTTTAGAHVFNSSTSSPNGQSDSNAANDAGSANFSSAGSNGQTVTFTLTPDDYGSETTWELKDSGGNTLYSGGPYTDGNSTPVIENWCLPPGCYDLVINDAYGDGICCGWGQGGYTIVSGAQTLVNFDGQFTTTDTQNFCITATGINGGEIGNNIQLYPNPNKGSFTLDLGLVEENTLVNIYNAVGELVTSETLQQQVHTFDLSTQAEGLYYLQVRINEQWHTQKISVVR
jgi:lysyl endopeptidase